MPVNTEFLRTPSGLLKIIELAFSIIVVSVCGGTKGFTYGPNQPTIFFCGGTLIMSLTVSFMLFGTHLHGHGREMLNSMFEIKFNLVMGIFMISTGGLIIHHCMTDLMDTSVADAGNAAGSFCIINGVVYGSDAFFAYQSLD